MKSAEKPILSIVGEKVTLGPLRRDLLSLYQRWFSDLEVMRAFAEKGPRPTTLESIEGWYDAASKSELEVHMLIYDRATLQPIGYADLNSIDTFHRTAEYDLLIGDKDYWGKGYGTEVTRLMLEYGFTALGLHNILLSVISFNERAVRAYLRAGFKEIGRRREAFRLGGRAYDEIYMDCLATEFHGSALSALLPDI